MSLQLVPFLKKNGFKQDHTCYLPPCKSLITYRHRLSSVQAVDGGLRFSMAGKFDKGAACPHG